MGTLTIGVKTPRSNTTAPTRARIIGRLTHGPFLMSGAAGTTTAASWTPANGSGLWVWTGEGTCVVRRGPCLARDGTGWGSAEDGGINSPSTVLSLGAGI